MPAVGLPERRPDRYGMVCRGYLRVPADGVRAGLRSDDGSQLLVGSSRDRQRRIDKQERHSSSPAAGARDQVSTSSGAAPPRLWLGSDSRPYAQVPADFWSCRENGWAALTGPFGPTSGAVVRPLLAADGRRATP
jgi:hypothetical protein